MSSYDPRMAEAVAREDLKGLEEQPAELLRRLIRFDTTNPPGNEGECVAFVEELLSGAGLDTRIVAADDARPNLIARLPGAGNAPPLLLHCHLDVVPTAGQGWTHPPFEAEVADGFVWGRGALDMKGGAAMMVAALLRARANGLTPPGDVIFAAMSDEEAGSGYGARFLVEKHPELFEGVRYALGEFGGATQHVAGRRLYPIQVAEKKVCRVTVTVRGPGGHGSLPMRGGTAAKLADVLRELDRKRLPVHVTPVARDMVAALREALPAPAALGLRLLLEPRASDRVLDVMGSQGEFLDPLLHNTVNAVTIRAGDKDNVIPSEAKVLLDGRILPGQDPDDLLRELHDVLGDEVELEVRAYDEARDEVDMGLFETLGGILREADPGSTPMPMLLAAVTDGRFFSRLGIQPYGFTPLKLPEGFEFHKLVHAADERVPVDAIEFGTSCLLKALERFGDAA
jgi:acetylornithine deacetylase/succinyl-diaminopimelate desuccinylase-like protein